MPESRTSPSALRPESAQAASHLQYPTLPPLSVSVEHWLSHSRPTNNMTSDRLSDAPSKSLSESWATLSVSDLHSEDGSRSEQTDTGSLIDQTTSDDVASLDDRYSSSDAGELDDDDHQGEEEDGEEQPDEEQSTLGSQQFPTLYTPVGSSIGDSGLTARPVFRQSSESIEFVEPEKWPEMERVELKHTIRIFDDSVASDMKSRLPASAADSILMATVQQTMTKQSLDLNKPFRVLYVGQPEYRNPILDKIGDVLVASSSSGSQTSSAESSRYHVVPTSYGVGAVPNFAELLPIHVQLVVDECMGATAEPSQDQPSTLHLSFKNRPSCRSWWDGARYRVSSASEWTLPDVAILFVSARDDAAAVKTQRLAHAFLKRHSIPAMVISEEPFSESATDILLNHDSLHMCLESRHPQTGETTVLQRYPIDLKTFESITPGQLNRNLASLIELYPNKERKTSATTPKPDEQDPLPEPEKSPLNWIPSHYATRARELVPMLRLVLLALISGIALSMGYVAVKAVVLFLAQWVAGSSLSRAFSPATTPIPTTVITLGNVKQTALSIRPSGNIDPVHDKIPDYTFMEQVADLTNAASSASIGPDAFDIQVVGDCHVIVKPPQHLATPKKQPRFNVSVNRYDRALPFELSRLFWDVYALRLDREEAWGVVNVTVTVKSMPGVNQTTKVDFGTPWLKIANWRRAARVVSSQLTKDLQIAQTGLTEIYGRLSTDLQVIMGDVVKRSHFLRHDAERLRHESQRARDSVLSRSKQVSQLFTRNALQRFRHASSVLHHMHHRSLWVNNRTQGLVKDAWSRLGRSAGRMDLHSMMDRARSAQCAALDRAQSRARQFVGRRARSSDCSESDDSKC